MVVFNFVMCNVWLCLCVVCVMCVNMFTCGLFNVCVFMCGLCNMWVFLSVVCVMCGCVYVLFV